MVIIIESIKSIIKKNYAKYTIIQITYIKC